MPAKVSLPIGQSLSLVVCTLAAVAMPQLACGPHAAGPDRRYELNGTVVSVDKRATTVTIAHEAVPGYMEAMTTPFKLQDERLLRDLAEGDRVHATLVVAGLRSWLDDVVFKRESVDSSNLYKPEVAQKTLHHGVGTVDSIDRERAAVQLDHQDIEGVMPAMNMPYNVKDKSLLDSIAPGDKVDFWLESTGAGLIVVGIKKR